MDKGVPLKEQNQGQPNGPTKDLLHCQHKQITPAQQSEIALNHSLQCVSHAFLLQTGVSVAIAVTLVLLKKC